MRTLINYIRSCFCKHEWQCLIEKCPVYASEHENPIRYIWVYRCVKCGCEGKVTVIKGGYNNENGINRSST